MTTGLTLSDFLGYAVLLMYIVIALMGWAITFFSYKSPRYYPVVTLMASGMGAPVVALAVVRAARLLGYWPNANAISAQITLLIAFCYTAWVWTAALNMVFADALVRGRRAATDGDAAASRRRGSE